MFFYNSHPQVHPHNTSPSTGQKASFETGSKSQSSSSAAAALAPNGLGKTSMVWVHSKSITVKGHIKPVCQVEILSGVRYGTHINPERSSSTKNLIWHLNLKRKIFESSIPDAGILQNILTHGKLFYVRHHNLLAFSLIYYILKYCFDVTYFTSSMDNLLVIQWNQG